MTDQVTEDDKKLVECLDALIQLRERAALHAASKTEAVWLRQAKTRIESLSAEVERWKNNADNERLRADEAEAEWTNWREQAKMYEQQMGVQAERAEASEARVRALEEALKKIIDVDTQMHHGAHVYEGPGTAIASIARAALGASNG